jgi:RimJ/RimL family protein N-acetyltransferase
MIDPAESIETRRFRLRALNAADATERYSRWLDEESARRYILSADERHDVAALRAYIAEKSGREDVLFLGIFTREAGEHIGNIKYESVDPVAGRAVMGILIGEPAWRGKGVAEEVIDATAGWLHTRCGIREIVLGVAKDNPVGLKAYLKAGFEPFEDAHYADNPYYANTRIMVRRLGSAA